MKQIASTYSDTIAKTENPKFFSLLLNIIIIVSYAVFLFTKFCHLTIQKIKIKIQANSYIVFLSK
jgi:hypothetical protein